MLFEFPQELAENADFQAPSQNLIHYVWDGTWVSKFFNKYPVILRLVVIRHWFGLCFLNDLLVLTMKAWV